MAYQNINDAIQYLQSIIAAVDGMRKAPEYPTEQASGIYPFAVTYNGSMTSSRMLSFNTVNSDYEIVTNVHVGRKDLPRDVQLIETFFDSIPRAIWQDLMDTRESTGALGGWCSTINEIRITELTGGEYGGEPTLMFTVTTVIKVNPFLAR